MKSIISVIAHWNLEFQGELIGGVEKHPIWPIVSSLKMLKCYEKYQKKKKIQFGQ